MGWVWYNESLGKPLIYNFAKISHDNHNKGDYWPSDIGYYSWQSHWLWQKEDVCIKYVNTDNFAVKIDSVSIKSMSANSGGQQYYSTTGLVPPASGNGGTYYSYIHWFGKDGIPKLNSNRDPENTSSVGKADIPDETSSNMLWAGDGTSLGHTASFDKSKMKLHTYHISDCPAINPGEGFYLHFGMERFNTEGLGNKSITVQFSLIPSEMNIDIKPSDTPCIWKFGSDGDWHLVKELYKWTGTEWKSMYTNG